MEIKLIEKIKNPFVIISFITITISLLIAFIFLINNNNKSKNLGTLPKESGVLPKIDRDEYLLNIRESREEYEKIKKNIAELYEKYEVEDVSLLYDETKNTLLKLYNNLSTTIPHESHRSSQSVIVSNIMILNQIMEEISIGIYEKRPQVLNSKVATINKALSETGIEFNKILN